MNKIEKKTVACPDCSRRLFDLIEPGARTVIEIRCPRCGREWTFHADKTREKTLDKEKTLYI